VNLTGIGTRLRTTWIVALTAVALLASMGAPAARAATKPGTPEFVRAVAGDRSVTVTWGPAPDGGSPITGYSVHASGGQFVQVPGDARTVTLTGLVNGGAYRVQVWADNAEGSGFPGGFSNEFVPAGLPAAPETLSLTAAPDGAVRVSWIPGWPNGADISRYTLTTHPSGFTSTIHAAVWDASPPDPAGASYYWVDLPGLRSGIHTVSVTATNAVGTSAGTSESFEVSRTDHLWAGDQLAPGEELRSANGRYSLTMQEDGNLVVYADDGRPLWHSRTWGQPGTRVQLQPDGNLVAYAADDRSAWHSATWGHSDLRLVMQDDGNLVLYADDGSPKWFTGWDRGPGAPDNTLHPLQQLTAGQSLSSANGLFSFVMQPDGNAVVYGPGRRALWHTSTWGRSGNRLVFQPDGNVVVATPSRHPVWHAGTWAHPDDRLVMQDDGNLVVYAAGGRPLWSWMTGRL
jgi:Fibronectin type III domain